MAKKIKKALEPDHDRQLTLSWESIDNYTLINELVERLENYEINTEIIEDFFDNLRYLGFIVIKPENLAKEIKIEEFLEGLKNE